MFDYDGNTMASNSGIEVTIAADSIHDYLGARITTFILRYPRFIHSELMTHRMFSRNASSSRAQGGHRLNDQLRSGDIAIPTYWGANEVGMQATEQVDSDTQVKAEMDWRSAAGAAIDFSDKLYLTHGIHKQTVNRLTEPFQFINTIVTATEWENFYKLRTASDAQPEIQELARMMEAIHSISYPNELVEGEWHIPMDPGEDEDLTTRLTVSAARCARVSYSNHTNDISYEKDRKLVQRLVDDGHMTPFEHQAVPIPQQLLFMWPKDATHKDRDGNFWCRNLRWWSHARHFIETYGEFPNDPSQI